MFEWALCSALYPLDWRVVTPTTQSKSRTQVPTCFPLSRPSLVQSANRQSEDEGECISLA